MKKAISFLIGLSLSFALITCGLENSAAEEKTWFTTPDTVSVIAEQLLNRMSKKSQEPVTRKKFSFTPKPLAGCSSFLITEFGIFYDLDKPSDETSLQLAAWEFGCMVNANKRSAIGGTVFIVKDLDDAASWFGLRARYRYWLSRRISLDIAPGILLKGWKTEFRFPSFSCQTGLNLNSWLAITGQVDIISWKKSEYVPTLQNGWTQYAWQERTVTKPEWYLGLKLGTPKGAGIGTAVAVIAAAIVAGTVSSFSLGDMEFDF